MKQATKRYKSLSITKTEVVPSFKREQFGGRRLSNQFVGAFISSFLSFVIFYYKLCPTVYFWDSAELTTAAYMLGIPHSPGFPLYILLGRVMTFFPLGDIGFRMNFFSALSGAFTIFILNYAARNILDSFLSFKAIYREYRQYIISAFLLLFAFSFSSLTQATRAEVYYPNLLLISICLFLATKKESGKAAFGRDTILCFFLIGLGVGMHHLTVLLIVPGIVILLWNSIKKGKWEIILLSAMAFLLGASVVAFIPIRFSAGAGYVWGDPSSLDGFIKIFTASDFGIPKGTFAPQHFLKVLSFSIGVIFRQIGLIGAIGFLVGLFIMMRGNRRNAIGLIFILIMNTCSVLFFEEYFYSYLDLHGYLLTAVALSVIISAIGWAVIIPKILANFKINSNPRYKLYYGFASLVLLSIGLLSADSFSYSLHNDQSAGVLIEKMVEPLPVDATILCSSTNTVFLLDYAKYTQGKYFNLNIIDINSLNREWYIKRNFSRRDYRALSTAGGLNFDIEFLISENPAKLYLELSPPILFLSNNIVPDGVLYRYTGETEYRLPKTETMVLASNPNDMEYQRIYAEWLLNRGLYYYSNGMESEADGCFKNLANIDPNSTDIVNNYKKLVKAKKRMH